MSQAQIAAKRSIAKSFAFEVEKLRGAEAAANFYDALIHSREGRDKQTLG